MPTSRVSCRSVPLLVLGLATFIGCQKDSGARAAEESSGAISPNAGRVVVGIGVRDLTPIDLQRSGGADLRGAYIGVVMPGSPAERVGIRIGDVVLMANRQPILRAQDLQQLISTQRGGSILELTVQRAGQLLMVPVRARQESGRIG